MKILEMKILNELGVIKREILFNENGASYIFGDITKPTQKNETSNSIGKTLLLGFINYIFGADENKDISKKAILNWSLEAKIKYNKKIYIVKRVIGSSEMYIDGKKETISDYKKKFNLSRSIISRQIFINDRSTLIPSYDKNPNKDDVKSFLSLINLGDMIESTDNYYQLQDNIKKNKSTRTRLLELNNWNQKDTDARLFYVEKRIEELQKDIASIDTEYSEEEITTQKQIAIENYTVNNKELKSLEFSKQKLIIENKRLEVYIKEAQSLNRVKTQIEKIYTKANYELSDMIKRNLEEVQAFYKSTVLDRKKISNDRILNNTKLIEKYTNETFVIRENLKKTDILIRESDAFREALLIYKNLNEELQTLMFEKGNLNNMSQLQNNIDEEDSNLNEAHSILVQLRKDHEDLIVNYREYLFNIVKILYPEKVRAFFDIKVRLKHQTTRPIEVELKIDGDSGEGVGTVRKRLIDILIFNWNTQIEFLLQDSSCFTGVDRRQISRLLEITSNIANIKDKQYIVSLNRFQIDETDDHLLALVEGSTVISLDEDNKLLGFDF